MASPRLKPQPAGSKGINEENPQHTSDRILYSPMLDASKKNDKRKELDTDFLDPSRFDRLSPSPLLQSGRASPISLQDLFLPPTTISISDHGAVPATRKGFRGVCAVQWHRHKAPLLVVISQLFGALMNLAARLLELGEVDEKLDPMQLLFCRMLLTTLACVVYIHRRRIPHGVLGDPKVRWLLLARGSVGFFGIYGMWYSMKYLPLAEATVITFLAPNLAGYWCHLLLGDPYTRTEQFASLLALGGIVLITKPTTLLSSGTTAAQEAQALADNSTGLIGPDSATTSERLGAIGFALLGVLGGSFAFTAMRAIGTRAHTLVSVNYFSTMCVLVTFSVLTIAPLADVGQPDLRLGLPSSLRQWGLLLFITSCGLATQVLITKGLAAERSNRAVAMTYTHMLFAAGFDRFVWGTSLDWLSGTGCAMIVAGAVWVAVGKNNNGGERGVGDGRCRTVDVESAMATSGAEGIPMLSRREDDDEGDIEYENLGARA
ncbi:hypothetical protein GGS20DRAFT_502229 [Poronia punctata]|nr:hypothetical protein GGS20DRAFT_502229 [Poronia punctata]